MFEKWRQLWPDALLLVLMAYVALLGYATVDQLMGWESITPLFK
jgi:hypothetical protein